jgi:hypothetical protein
LQFDVTQRAHAFLGARTTAGETFMTIKTLCGLALLSVALYAPSALAQQVQEKKTTTTTTTTTTNSSGTVSQFGPTTIVIKTTPTSSPVTYEFNDATTYVDEAGNPVEMEAVKSGIPVTVFYSKQGDKMVATKVIVKQTMPAVPRG